MDLNRRSARELEVRRLGIVSYSEALELQKQLVEDRKTGRIPDQLLLLQHPPVITLGVKTRGNRSNIVASASTLEREGVEVFETGRGGDVTYHGPGQLVGYPIIDLKPDRCDVHRYVRDIEEVMIRIAASFNVTATRITGLTGAWVGTNKLAAIGVRISRWVTSHGFALNVTTNLGHFDLIVPCGIRDHGVTSLETVLGRSIAIAEVEDASIEAFERVFERSAVHAPATGPVTSP
jgi:lipoyl(octanoyl) transferase